MSSTGLSVPFHHQVMFRLCGQPSYWLTILLMVAAGMGPILAIKYFRYTYRPSKINTLQQAERLGGPILSLGNIEPQQRLIEKEVAPLSITQPKNRNPVYEPLLSDSPAPEGLSDKELLSISFNHNPDYLQATQETARTIEFYKLFFVAAYR
ncbi:hypothetical protein OIU78_023902 [Salix suchowensis]|nr:hypothetical protein OIU78_023902 [Salix suchowensis]